MPLRLRFAIHGRRNHRIFHLVAIEQRKRRDAKPTELLGIYNPVPKQGESHKTIEWSVDRIKYWLDVGALPSKSVVRLLEWGGIIPPDSKYHPRALGPRRVATEEILSDAESIFTTVTEETGGSVSAFKEAIPFIPASPAMPMEQQPAAAHP